MLGLLKRGKKVGSEALVATVMALMAVGLLYGAWQLGVLQLLIGAGVGGGVVAWAVGPRLAEAENWSERGQLVPTLQLANRCADLERITGEQQAVLIEHGLHEEEGTLFAQLATVS